MTFATRLYSRRKRKKYAETGEYRTVVPKKGVYLHVKKKATGKVGAKFLRRTRARAAKAGKPLREEI